MNLLFALVILASPPTPSIAPSGDPASLAHGEAAVEVFRCDFDDAADRNYDSWPDHWTRRRGAGYPLFVPIGIEREAGDRGGRALRIDLDGGAGEAISPAVAVSSLFSYQLTAQVRTSDLKHNGAGLAISVFDKNGRLLETHHSQLVTKGDGWTTLEIGPLAPQHAESHTAQISLLLRPRHPDASDLRGSAWFRQVQLSRWPRVVLRTTRKLHLYTSPQDVEVVCEVSGVPSAAASICFSLENLEGETLATHETPLTTKAQASSQASWRPQVPDYGFYRVRAILQEDKARRIERATTLAVLRKLPECGASPFGWSLPRGDSTLALNDILTLTQHAGVRWVKFPMWYAADDTKRADHLAWFAERASAQQMQVIGLLDLPPPAVRRTLADPVSPPIATVFVEAPLWQPAVDPVMTRLSLKVRWWQLGADHDVSFAGFPHLERKIDEIKQYFLKYGQEVRVGLAWPWIVEPPAGSDVPWDFLHRTATPSLTPRELTEYLASPTGSEAAAERWISLEPLAKSRYDLATRTRDLVHRMLAAKMRRAQGAFVPDPFDPEHGLLRGDGTPGELFLPWRTMAFVLGDAEYLGSIHLPGGSDNHLLRHDDEAVLIVWNEQPTTESLYLGDAVRHFDLWGRAAPVETTENAGAKVQSPRVGPLPTIVTGLSLPVAKFRLSFAFDQPKLESVFGRDQSATFHFRNAFGQGIGGKWQFIAPSEWELSPGVNDFRAAPGEEVTDALTVRFKPEASCGKQLLRCDVQLTAERDYAFSVYSPLQVGRGDVFLEIDTRLGDDGNLVVEQTLVNQTDALVSFDCVLFAPGRRRERAQVTGLGRGRHTSLFVLPQGAELAGHTLLLRAEEINGPRVLNYRVTPAD